MLECYKTECDKADIEIDICKGSESEELQNLLYEINSQMIRSFDGVMFHGAAIIYNEKAYLFAAPSGTGKTTHISLWQECFSDKVTILNGDKPFIRFTDGEFYVYGSPWQGKEKLGFNGKARLGGIYLLQRADTNSICKASSNQILNGLVKSVLIEKNTQDRLKVIDILNRIYKTIPVNVLYCNTDKQAAYIVKQHIDREAPK